MLLSSMCEPVPTCKRNLWYWLSIQQSLLACIDLKKIVLVRCAEGGMMSGPSLICWGFQSPFMSGPCCAQELRASRGLCQTSKRQLHMLNWTLHALFEVKVPRTQVSCEARIVTD